MCRGQGLLSRQTPRTWAIFMMDYMNPQDSVRFIRLVAQAETRLIACDPAGFLSDIVDYSSSHFWIFRSTLLGPLARWAHPSARPKQVGKNLDFFPDRPLSPVRRAGLLIERICPALHKLSPETCAFPLLNRFKCPWRCRPDPPPPGSLPPDPSFPACFSSPSAPPLDLSRMKRILTEALEVPEPRSSPAWKAEMQEHGVVLPFLNGHEYFPRIASESPSGLLRELEMYLRILPVRPSWTARHLPSLSATSM